MEKKLFYTPGQETVHDLQEEKPSQNFRTVLLLEDEDQFTNVLRTFLEENNFLVTPVRNGVEGLKKIMSADFDVIICDMMMPNLPGDMFYVAVERTKPHLCKRFVFMTGYKGDKKVDEFIRKVRGVMLFKPFRMFDMLDTINAVLRKADMAGG